MLGGVKEHHSFDQFDITAILNFMYHCKHFKDFTAGQYLTKVKLLHDSGHIRSFFSLMFLS